ncbi:MAG: hypothetical protein NVV63_04440 [Opitutus sp.]|nr:hypothetical protein [Opitutus sp.]
MPDYSGATKNKVRELMLGSAVDALTTKRHSAEIIAGDELRVTFDRFLQLIEAGWSGAIPFEVLHQAAEAELADWIEFDACSNAPREPRELKVLYLCGPSPNNDLRVLLKHGINIHNVWAVTGSSDDSAAAHAELAKFNFALKIHEGSLADFFENYNEVFDLIYFDACGPFMGGRPSTLTPLLAILERQRL